MEIFKHILEEKHEELDFYKDTKIKIIYLSYIVYLRNMLAHHLRGLDLNQAIADEVLIPQFNHLL
jgi:hypothetical protein